MRTPRQAFTSRAEALTWRVLVAAMFMATIATLSAFASIPSLAAQPTLAKCNKLQAEQDNLTKQGIEQDLEKGPQWARANLPANRVSLILHYLKVYEQVVFQCETVFAVAEANEARRAADAAARARVLANIPPPPERAPPPSQRPARKFARTKAGLIAIPPLPIRGTR